MKSILTSIVIFSFIGIAVFGIFAMAHSMNQEHGGCIAATSRGESCPIESNLLQTLAYHFDSFRSFSTAILSGNFDNSLLLLFAFALLVGFWIFRNTGLKFSVSSLNQNAFGLLESRESLLQLNLTHWLSLHENSPSFS